MRTILFILQKEFRQVFRNRSMLPIIFAVPVLQLIIIVHAATFEMKSIKMFVVDQDHTSWSRQMISHFKGSPFYRIRGNGNSMKEAEDALQHGKVDAILNISKGFEKNLIKENEAVVQLVINAINGMAGGLTHAYSQSVIALFNKELIENNPPAARGGIYKSIDLTYSFWYNPDLNYINFMVPGILVILVTVISLVLSGMNIVREKEIGTIEQINVTPIRKTQFIIGKLLPFLVIALFELAFGLTIGKIFFHIPMAGSLWLVFLVAVIYITVILGLGLFISTLANTQQQAMFVSFFFMIVFILMSGLFTAAENMPQWARTINLINPVAYFIRAMRMLLLKGSGMNDILTEIISLLALSIIVLSLAVRRYRKTT